MSDILIKTIETENGKLYYTKNGSRYELADCDIDIDVWEHRTGAPRLGASRGVARKRFFTLVCTNLEPKQEITDTFLGSISRFEAQADILTPKGYYERIYFDNLSEADIDLDDEWQFEIIDNDKLKRFI